MRALKAGFKNLPIQRKISLVILLTCLTALAVAGAAIFFTQLATFRQNFRRDLEALGQILGNNSIAAVAFKDRNSAQEILEALKAKSHIVRATLELADGTEFATFARGGRRSPPPVPKQDGFQFAEGFLVLNQPVVLAGTRLGTLRLVSDYQTEYRHSLRVYGGILGVVLLVSVLLALALSERLQPLISAPILALAKTAQRVAGKRDYTARALKLGEDEVGQLTDEFNQMLEEIENHAAALHQANQSLELEIAERKRTELELEKIHKQLMIASHQAGMAEVATGVLHNVGNVLNSINLSSTVIGDCLRDSRVGNLGKAVGLLREHRTDLGRFLTEDPKGKMLPGYLETLANHLAAERNEMLQEMENLTKYVDHVKEIVIMQQNYAKLCGVIETISPVELVEDAIRLNSGAFQRHGITIVREFTTVPKVTVDKHKVLQILINLIRNAKYAMDEQGPVEKRLVLGLRTDGADRIVISVEDNGIGIAPENLTRIFSHGYTTRRDGHGFGLHSGALAAREMGGQLSASSEGRGKGATFCLELPSANEPPPSENHENRLRERTSPVAA